MTTTLQKIAIARFRARRALPYFGKLISALVPVEVPGYGTFGVTEDGVMLVDPAVVATWTHDLIAGVIVHEGLHISRRHAERRRAIGADPKLWNVAADAEINDDLLETSLPLPEGRVTPESIGCKPGLPAEVYYRHLCEQQGKNKGKDKSDSNQQGGDEQGDDGSGAGDEGGKQAKGDSKGKGKGKGVTAGDCGGCAGNPGEGEQGAAGDVEGRTPRELESVRRQVAEAIRQAAARGRGDVPGGWARWAETQLAPPKIPWSQKLAKVARASVGYRSGAVDYTYRRVSRRQSGIGFGAGVPIVPALYAPQPKVTIVVDTSGSMGDKEVTKAIAETRGILLAVGGKVTFVACNAAVHSLKPITRWQDAGKFLKGGGGTDFCPAFDAINKQRERPDLVVFITDGDGPAPKTAPVGYKVVWVLVGSHCRRPAKWGEAIEIDKEAA